MNDHAGYRSFAWLRRCRLSGLMLGYPHRADDQRQCLDGCAKELANVQPGEAVSSSAATSLGLASKSRLLSRLAALGVRPGDTEEERLAKAVSRSSRSDGTAAGCRSVSGSIPARLSPV